MVKKNLGRNGWEYKKVGDFLRYSVIDMSEKYYGYHTHVCPLYRLMSFGEIIGGYFN